MGSSVPQSGAALVARGVLFAALWSICGVVFAIERDFNGDLRADVLWRHQGPGGTGQNYVYPLNGTAILAGEGNLRTVSDLNWEVAGIGDFDGDGKADILWRNQANGQNYIYFMGGDGKTIIAEGFIRTLTDLHWKVAGVGDFDGDGKADILWRNSANGQNYIYPMHGLTIKLGEGYIRTVADPNWQVVGVGNFDGSAPSATADILWRNQANGQNYVYLMNGTTIAAEGFIRTVSSSSWKVAGVGDFDGDGNADILWRNSTNGQNYIYPMDGLAIKPSEGYIRTLTNQNWQVAGVANYDGNTVPAPTADILWRNVSTGENYLYPMDGTTILPTEGYLRTVSDRDWKVQPAPACPAVSSGALTLTVDAARNNGVAPLGVFFDATTTTSPAATSRPFHEIEYQWNFGDGASGSWSATPGMPNLSRNLASGPVAAHVYERPGTYTACVTAFDGTNMATASIRITVTDPNSVFAANTLCVGAGPEPVAGTGGCPAGAEVLARSDFAATINGRKASSKRILFRRGDTFIANADAVIDVNGPGIIGAFGTGAAPIVDVVVGSTIFPIRISDQDTPTVKDWRIMDLEINGNSGPDTNGVIGFGQMDQLTLLRLNIHHVNVGVKLSPFFLDSNNRTGHPGHALWDQFVMVDSTIHALIGGEGGNGMYIGARRFALMGNVLRDANGNIESSVPGEQGAEHILRTPNVYKGVISHNNMSNPNSAKHVVKLQAVVFVGISPTTFSEQIVISDNKFTAGTGASWTVTLGPQDDDIDEKVRDVIVERNWFAPHPDQEAALMIWAQDITVRNNLFNLTGTSDERGLFVDQRGIGPVPENVHVYNNTFYSSNSISGNFIPMTFVLGTGVIAKNNLGYAPLSISPVMVSGTATVIDQNNTGDALISPAFVGLTPLLAPADFALGAGSSALSAGAPVPVFSDFFRRSRPKGAVDRGAFEKP